MHLLHTLQAGEIVLKIQPTVMIKIVILSSLLCLGSAWNQPSTCYVRQSSSSCSSSSEIQELRSDFQNDIQELRSYLETSLEAITSTLEQLVDRRIGTFDNPATSCSEISSDRPSGYYWLVNGTTPLQVYCDTNRTSCSCNTTGGWMRVANFDMTNPNQSCPDGFRLVTRNEPPLRTCGRFTGPGCVSTTYPVYGVPYSQVCGRVVAYQDGTPDAFVAFFGNPTLTVEDSYVDGVSLTHGQSPRQHIWTFAAALDETRSEEHTCPCIQSDQPFTGTIPSFVGNDYFCDTGSRNQHQFIFYPDDPLWDGAGCGGTSTCCQFNNPPWFCKQLPQPTTDDIELRICGNVLLNNEDIPIEIVEIFIR